MIKKLILSLAVTTTLASVGIASAQAASNSCKPVDGVAIANFYGEGEGKPVIISAASLGGWANAAGKITAQRKTATGLEMDMEHYFGTPSGGGLLTKDLGVLTAVPGKPGRYMIEITYDVQEGTARSVLKGYKGQFNSYGLVDLRDPNNMGGLVRFFGEICK